MTGFFIPNNYNKRNHSPLFNIDIYHTSNMLDFVILSMFKIEL